ncbi:1678_t:CDS:2 [Cetraspora pellucida]|uniref:1678_t:CDS:1 n=1 Tax=Cetraspora pellucida TaxID=1433469 RepID=A0A9N9CF51_9GLOM|nr:1678_t:CDS:2 [Cetraspora pellucida]
MMSQTGINDKSYNEFDNLKEESSKLSQNKADEVTSEEVSEDLSLFITSINCNGISKWRLLEKLSIPHISFKQAASLYIGLQFEHWDHNKKLDKNSGVYKYVFECQHAKNYQLKKKATDPSQQCNWKSVKMGCICFINICWPLSAPSSSITKLNLIHHGYTLCSNNAHFINIYQQLPQNIIDKVRFYVKAVPNIS